MSDDEQPDGDADASTTSTAATRHTYTNDIIAATLVFALVSTVGVYVYRGQSVPLWLATSFTAAVTTAVVWGFGKGAAAAAVDMIRDDR